MAKNLLWPFIVALASLTIANASTEEGLQRQIDEVKQKISMEEGMSSAILGRADTSISTSDRLTLDRLQRELAALNPAPTPTPAAAVSDPTPDPWDNPEFKGLLKPRTEEQKKEEQDQKKETDAQTKADQIKHAYGSDDNLRVLSVRWRKGGFDTVSIITVTLKNVSKSPITDLRYDTVYRAENGEVVTKGGTHEFLGVKDVKKVIAPGQTRTIEIDDGFIQSEAVSMSFQIVGYESR